MNSCVYISLISNYFCIRRCFLHHLSLSRFKNLIYNDLGQCILTRSENPKVTCELIKTSTFSSGDYISIAELSPYSLISVAVKMSFSDTSKTRYQYNTVLTEALLAHTDNPLILWRSSGTYGSSTSEAVVWLTDFNSTQQRWTIDRIQTTYHVNQIWFYGIR